MENPQGTEEIIKEVARKIFLEKGFAGATIRDIAREANTNVALVNYYFRSKELLFESIYKETFRGFMSVIAGILNEPSPFEVKIWKLADKYTDFILENPQVPLFVLTQHRNNIGEFFKGLDLSEKIANSVFLQQLNEEIQAGRIRDISPLQILISLVSNIITPVMAKPAIRHIASMSEADYLAFIETRKHLVPEMIMAFLKSK